VNKTEFKAQVLEYSNAIDQDTDWVSGSEWLRESARAIDSYLTDNNEDYNLPKIVASLESLTIRDYFMGVMDKDNPTHQWRISLMVDSVPINYASAPACYFSLLAFEGGNNALALSRLDKAKQNYPLAILLKRVYLAEWDSNSFSDLRKELHPKVCTTIFGESVMA